MPRVPPLDRPATYDDLEKIPDVMIAEIVAGELHATPRPGPRHAVAWTTLAALINTSYQQGSGGPGGWWIIGEPELHLGPDVLVPDLAGWRRTRMSALPEGAFFTVPPDWVCEVLSPSTASLDRVNKLAIYAREGVGVAWLVDPTARSLEVFHLEAGRWVLRAAHDGSAVVHVEPFAEIGLNLAALWPDAR